MARHKAVAKRKEERMRQTTRVRHPWWIALVAVVAAVSCVRIVPPPQAPAGTITRLTVTPTVGDWASYNGNYANDRFSPLAEIRTNNVHQLERLCMFDTGDTTSFQNGPVV